MQGCNDKKTQNKTAVKFKWIWFIVQINKTEGLTIVFIRQHTDMSRKYDFQLMDKFQSKKLNLP